MQPFLSLRILAALCTIVFSVACTPRLQSPITSGAATPALRKSSVCVDDGYCLPLRSYLPQGIPKAVIIGIHGFNDYSAAYDDLAKSATQQGVALYAYDQRGFGANTPRGIWAGKARMVADTIAIIHLIKQRYPDIPVFLMGESMGGSIALLSAAQAPDILDGVILSAPALWHTEGMPWYLRSSAWLGAHVAPWYRMSGEGQDILASDNLPMLYRLGQDPMVTKYTRIDSGYFLLQLMQEAAATPAPQHTPIWLLYGAHDELVPPPAMLTYAQDNPHVHLAYYNEGFHLLSRDLYGKIVIEDILYITTHNTLPLPSRATENAKHRLRHDLSTPPKDRRPQRLQRKASKKIDDKSRNCRFYASIGRSHARTKNRVGCS